MLDLLEGKKPDAKEMEFFKMYAQLIERARKRLVQYNEEYTNGSKNKNDNY
ncbi:MAG: hypothetical protein K2J16_04625 [Clostridia bacterium]|nr:hypothetical protein [Clostridia bacterium]